MSKIDRVVGTLIVNTEYRSDKRLCLIKIRDSAWGQRPDHEISVFLGDDGLIEIETQSDKAVLKAFAEPREENEGKELDLEKVWKSQQKVNYELRNRIDKLLKTFAEEEKTERLHKRCPHCERNTYFSYVGYCVPLFCPWCGKRMQI